MSLISVSDVYEFVFLLCNKDTGFDFSCRFFVFQKICGIGEPMFELLLLLWTSTMRLLVAELVIGVSYRA